MTHIDPFAPADSPQHPANWGHESGPEVMNPTPADEDMAPRWIAIIGDPITDDDAGQRVADARWEEYDQLLREHGTERQVQVLDFPVDDWPEDMPTLVELRERAAVPPAEDGEAANEEQEGDLASALAKLDEAGL